MSLVKKSSGTAKTTTATVFGEVVKTGLEVNGLPAIEMKVTHGLGLEGQTVKAFLSTSPENGGDLEKRPNFDKEGLSKTKIKKGSPLAIEGCSKSGEGDEIVLEGRYPNKLTDSTKIDPEGSIITTPLREFGSNSFKPKATLTSPKDGAVARAATLESAIKAAHAAVDNATDMDAINVFAHATFKDDDGVESTTLIHKAISFNYDSGEKNDEGYTVWATKEKDVMKGEITELLTEGSMYVFSKEGGRIEMAELFAEDGVVSNVDVTVVPSSNLVLTRPDNFKDGEYEGIRFNVSRLGVPVDHFKTQSGDDAKRLNVKPLKLMGAISLTGKEADMGAAFNRLANQVEWKNGSKAEATAKAEDKPAAKAEAKPTAKAKEAVAPAPEADSSDPFGDDAPGM